MTAARGRDKLGIIINIESMASATYEFAVRLPSKLFNGNRARFVEALRKEIKGATKPLLAIKGSSGCYYADSDTWILPLFQNSWFYYLFGVKEEDMNAVIDLNTGVATLFAPRMDYTAGTWMPLLTAEYYEKIYGLETKYNDQF